MVLSEGSRVPTTGTENPIVLVCGAAIKSVPLQEITGKSNGNRPPIENEWHIRRYGPGNMI